MNRSQVIREQLQRIKSEDNSLLKSIKNIRFKSKQINLLETKKIEMTSDHKFIISLNNELKYLGNSGEELEKIQIPNLITFGIIGASVVLALSFKNSRLITLTEWNFITKKVSEKYYQLKLPESTVQLIIFRDSKLACLAEIEKKRNSFLLSYYKLPLQKNSSTLWVIGNEEKEQTKPKAKLFKIDNHSMVGFAFPSPKEQIQKYIQLYTYSLNKVSLRRMDTFYKFDIQLKGSWLQFIIKDIYLINDEQFYFQIKIQVDLKMHQEYLGKKRALRRRNEQKQDKNEELVEEQKIQAHQIPNQGLHNCHKNFYWNCQKHTIRNSVIGREGAHFIQFVNSMRQFKNLYQCNTQVHDLFLIPIFLIHSDNQQLIGLHTAKKYENLSWSNYQSYSIAHLKESEQKQPMLSYYGSLHEYDLKILQIPLWTSLRMTSTFFLCEMYENWSQSLLEQVGDLLQY